jgi:hypothetical protein
MCPANLKRIRPKIIDCVTTRALAHARSNVCEVREHKKYVALATCCDVYYVHSKCEEKPSIDKRTVSHARARTRALARVPAVREHDKYVAHVTFGLL